jgi:hypothetical protein
MQLEADMIETGSRVSIFHACHLYGNEEVARRGSMLGHGAVAPQIFSLIGFKVSCLNLFHRWW